MSRSRLAVILLACVLLAAAGVRAAAAADKPGLTHDESISLLAAACHQGDYTRLTFGAQPPFGRWVAASEWKALLQPERPLCLTEIGRDLAAEDIHPPLYFWLLHGWTLAFGVSLFTGLALNIVLATLTGVALFALARRVLGDPLRAVAVAAVWSFSPAAIRVFAEARQYELLALLATVFAWACLRFCLPATRTPRRDAALLALVTAAGALTQYLFALVALAGVALLFVCLARSRRALLAWGTVSIAAGYAIFSLLHPAYLLSIARSGAQRTAASAELLPGRVDQTARTLAEFLLPPSLARGGWAYGACGLLLALSLVAIVAARRAPRDRRLAATAVTVVALWLVVVQAALYLAFLTPASAMDFKHLSSVWPFAAFAPVLAVTLLPARARAPVGAVAVAGLAVVGTLAALAHHRAPAAPPPFEQARAVVLDNVARGVLPRIVWRLPDDAQVFAADQRHLLAYPTAWADRLRPGDVFVGRLPPSDPRYGNSPARGRRVAAELARRHRLSPLPDPLEPGSVFRLLEPLREASERPRDRLLTSRM